MVEMPVRTEVVFMMIMVMVVVTHTYMGKVHFGIDM